MYWAYYKYVKILLKKCDCDISLGVFYGKVKFKQSWEDYNLGERRNLVV